MIGSGLTIFMLAYAMTYKDKLLDKSVTTAVSKREEWDRQTLRCISWSVQYTERGTGEDYNEGENRVHC